MHATEASIASAVAALPAGPLTEDALARHVAPLFSRVRTAFAGRIYLANHSLGRPLDATADDVREGVDAWYARLGGAWDGWMAAMDAWRAGTATLVGAPRADCVVPKTSAGQGLRTVLNAMDGVARVVTTRGEFDSIDVILREYARRRRITLSIVEPREHGLFAADDVIAAIGARCDLVVVSPVMFATGQRVPALPAIVEASHRAGARVLLDVYHAAGVFPVDLAALGADYAVGGSYKYLRGGPGCCWLYVAPAMLDAGPRPLDVGWFGKERPFDYARPDPPRFAPGGDGWLESTPPVLMPFQARAGLAFTLAIGVARLREHSRAMQRRLVERLAAEGVHATGGGDDRGAFVVVEHDDAAAWSAALHERGVIADARGRWLRLTPDVLSTDDELNVAARALGAIARGDGAAIRSA